MRAKVRQRGQIELGQECWWQESWNRKAWKEQPGQVSLDRIERTGWLGHDSKDQTARTGELRTSVSE
jgi:hypothetical protein